MSLNESFNYLAIQEIFLRTSNAIKLNILKTLCNEISSEPYLLSVCNIIRKYECRKLSSHNNLTIAEDIDYNNLVIRFDKIDLETFISWFKSLPMYSRTEVVNALLKTAGPDVRANLLKLITIPKRYVHSVAEESATRLKSTSSNALAYPRSLLTVHYEQWDERMKQFPLRVEEILNRDKSQTIYGQEIDYIQELPIDIITKILLYLDETSLECLKNVNDYWLATIGHFNSHLQDRGLLNQHKMAESVLMMADSLPKQSYCHKKNKRSVKHTCNKALHKALHKDQLNLEKCIISRFAVNIEPVKVPSSRTKHKI